MSAGRSSHQDMKRSWSCLDFPSSCSCPPFPISLASLPAPAAPLSSFQLKQIFPEQQKVSWWEGLCHGQSCRVSHGLVASTKPVPSSSLQTQPLIPTPDGGTWGSTRALGGSISSGTKPCCHFWARSGGMEEIQGGEAGESCRGGAWWVLGCETSGLLRLQTHGGPEARLEMCLLQEGRRKGNFPERQKALWK